CVRGRNRVEWGYVAFGGDYGHRGIGFAASSAFIVADTAGENAVHAGRARIRDGSGDDFLRTSLAHCPGVAGYALEFAIDGVVCEKGSMKIKSLNHKGHRGTQRKIAA